MQEKIYILAAIETIINKNTTTDLDHYRLEYFLYLGNYTNSFYESCDMALIIGVKIRNKEINEIKWANVYYKIVSINNTTKEELLKEILSSSKDSQMNFILKSETLILKKHYLTSDFVEPNEFIKELKISIRDEFPVVKLGGFISKQIRQEINELFKLKINEIKSEVSDSKKLNKIYK